MTGRTKRNWESKPPHEDCTVVRKQNCVSQDHSASGHAQRYAQLVRDPRLLVLERPVKCHGKKSICAAEISEPADWQLQLVDST
jgi:hypothetical protein